ncbi:hypothetical protein V8B97DRAFT_1970170 [Scleroderma yunnanense]
MPHFFVLHFVLSICPLIFTLSHSLIPRPLALLHRPAGDRFTWVSPSFHIHKQSGPVLPIAMAILRFISVHSSLSPI